MGLIGTKDELIAATTSPLRDRNYRTRSRMAAAEACLWTGEEFQEQAAVFVHRIGAARTQRARAYLAPERVAASLLLAIPVPGIVAAVAPRLAAAREGATGRCGAAMGLIARGRWQVAGGGSLGPYEEGPQGKNPAHPWHRVALLRDKWFFASLA